MTILDLPIGAKKFIAQMHVNKFAFGDFSVVIARVF